MLSRFVILHHTTPAGEHWDLMLERSDVLETWQLIDEPVSRSSLPIVARRIGDHRKTYLDYEGPVSRNRGHVRRVDTGTVEFFKITLNRYDLGLSGTRLTGRFALVAEGDFWRLIKASLGNTKS